ncbi:HAD family hydrolase [Shewanella glacialipiscicola]|uniref:Haloacid dehalogenase n=1 Tax=Shewanella glacialipiscicola TaxID=614069 RepID=A0ABQ6J1L4_9GAMM|nr:HAD-IA family hydrolase [Shewanella glacialipiscicola]MCL1085883.1 HAD-IA family hydrolase [Shewanella glacialipiscicola]GIU09202.1 haloacid dehalogenase [Shewanella glacialipiscicola]GMA82017.1 haloacid dehalogenase [Shewanella glacialipiscicola]
MSLTQIKGVLFDLDGTLADTAPDLVQALNLSLQDVGIAPQPLEAMRYAASHGSFALVDAAIPNAADDLRIQVQQGLLAHYQRINGDHCELFTGIMALLDWLELTHVPFGVITNKPARFTRPLLRKLNLHLRMPVIISGDSTKHPKPHTAPMLLGAQQLGCAPSQILYLGDAERDLLAAKAAGMLGGVALWGYLGENDKPLQWPAHAYFVSPEQLHQTLIERLAC